MAPGQFVAVRKKAQWRSVFSVVQVVVVCSSLLSTHVHAIKCVVDTVTPITDTTGTCVAARHASQHNGQRARARASLHISNLGPRA